VATEFVSFVVFMSCPDTLFLIQNMGIWFKSSSFHEMHILDCIIVK